MPGQAAIVPVRALPVSTRARMLALLGLFFEGVTAAAFERDLGEKDGVILLEGPAGELQGFSTFRFLELALDGGRHRFLFSGDTIVHPDARGTSALAGAFGHVALEAFSRGGGTPLHWFLITKGFRTYRFLPLHFRHFIPRHDAADPAAERALLDAVARARFGPRYDDVAGVVRAAPDSDRLRPEAGGIPQGRLRDPGVAFFARRNPGHARGDELACLAPLDPGNFTAAGLRQIRRVRPRWQA